MFLSVREMELKKLRFETTYPPGDLEFADRGLLQASPLKVAGSAELAGATQEIRIRGRFQVRMEAECDRCLEAAGFDLDSEFDLFYRPETSLRPEEEVHLDDGEIQIGFYAGEGLRLRDVLCEQVLLALPMQRVCSQSCKGLCPQCGGNRNRHQCACRPEPASDRWAALKEL